MQNAQTTLFFAGATPSVVDALSGILKTMPTIFVVCFALTPESDPDTLCEIIGKLSVPVAYSSAHESSLRETALVLAHSTDECVITVCIEEEIWRETLAVLRSEYNAIVHLIALPNRPIPACALIADTVTILTL